MKNSLENGVNDKVATKVSELLDEESSLPTIILGGHNVFNNSISNSVVIQLNAPVEDLIEALEQSSESTQKEILNAILNTLERKHSQTSQS